MTLYNERSLQVNYIEEPELCFGFDQTSDNPKDGLYLFGPVDGPSRKDIQIGVVGTTDGQRYLKEWLRLLNRHIATPPPSRREKQNRSHLSDFPGFKEAFGICTESEHIVAYSVEASTIKNFTSFENHHESVDRTVDLFLKPIISHVSNEERIVDVWVLVIPEIVFERCRPLSQRNLNKVDIMRGDYSGKQSTRSDLPLLASVTDFSGEDIFDDVPDFHRQVKAKLLELGQTSQIIRETTIAPDNFLNSAGLPKRETQDQSTVAWNLATALYYKTQANPPWKLARMRPRVCYVGLVFKLLPNNEDNHVCCAAQMFLSEGDGIVFRGANGPWKTSKKEFHLSKEAAKQLIGTVLEAYRTKFKNYPLELFIHGTTKFNDDEWVAFREAAPDGTNIVGVRIRPTHGEMKLFREGDYPCLRGTSLILSETDAYLWTTGFAPRIDTYMGPETPNPLYITILKATSKMPSINRVLTDILGLTKINYNACNYSDGQPVTIKFANKVGEILVMGSARNALRQPFKFYV